MFFGLPVFFLLCVTEAIYREGERFEENDQKTLERVPRVLFRGIGFAHEHVSTGGMQRLLLVPRNLQKG